MAHHNQGVGGGTVLLAFVAGAAVGAAVALLFAPASGTETRAYVNRRAREARDRATEAAEQGRDIFNRQREFREVLLYIVASWQNASTGIRFTTLSACKPTPMRVS